MNRVVLRYALAAFALAGGPILAQEVAPLVRPLGGIPPPAAALLTRGGSGGALRLQATALPVAYPATAIPLLVVVELDGPSLISNHPGGRLGVEIYLYAIDNGGRIAASRAEGIAVDLDSIGSELVNGGLRWQTSVALDPGEWSLRVLARVRRSGGFGLREIRLTLPRPGSGGPFYLAPVAPSAPGFVDALSPSLDPAAGAALQALGGAPAAMPLLAADAPSRFWALVAGGDAAAFTSRLTDGLGRPAGEPTVTAGARQPLGSGLQAIALELTPPGGAAGLRDLVLALPGGKVAEPRRLIVRAGEEPGAWTDLLRIAAVGEESLAPPPATVVAPPASREEIQRIGATYLDAWSRYASGDQEGAVAAVETFESGLLASNRRRAMGWLDQSDRPLAAEVVRARPEAVLPLALFYGDLFRAHLATRRIGLARRAEMHAADLLDRFAELATVGRQKELAAAAYEGMAADLLSAEAPRRAADLLERATRVAPGRAADWLALAAIQERDRRFEQALAALDRVLSIEPRNREARLRQARIEQLRGNSRRAATAYDALAAEPVVDWIGVVAIQERARQLLADGELAAAVVLLESAGQRFPAEPSLALALSYAYERAGRRASARAAADRAVAARPAFAGAPRKRYSAPPIEALSSDRAEVETAGLLAGKSLAEALAALPAGRGR